MFTCPSRRRALASFRSISGKRGALGFGPRQSNCTAGRRQPHLTASHGAPAQQLTEAHDQLGQEHWHPRGPMLVLLEQKAFIEFEQLLGIVNGIAASNYGGGVTPKQWRKLQDKFVH